MGVLEGKAVVITGAGRGIGAAYARASAAEGASVIVNDVDLDMAESVAAEIVAAGHRATPDGSDITSWDQAAALIDHCVDELGAIDGIVNNAGLFTIGAPEEYTEQDWRSVMEANVLGTAFCGTHAIRRMLAQGHGSIVNVTSGSSLGVPLQTVYGASKGAVTSMTYDWAYDLADRGLRVNAISPMAYTRMNDTLQAYFVRKGMKPWPSLTVAPEQNAALATFLLSDDATGVNGQIIRIENDRLSVMSHPAVIHPALSKPTWTHQDIREAFAETLFDRQFPLGVVATTGEVVDYPSAYLPADEDR